MEHGVDSARCEVGVGCVVDCLRNLSVDPAYAIDYRGPEGSINQFRFLCLLYIIYTVRAPSKPALDLKPLLIRNRSIF